jgi:hypothetical protein
MSDSEAIVDDYGIRPDMFNTEFVVSLPVVPDTKVYSRPVRLSSGFVEGDPYIEPVEPIIPVHLRQTYLPESIEEISLFAVPIPDPELINSAGIRDPNLFFNSDTRIYALNGEGGSGTLQETLANGNSAGVYNIDMNANSIENVNSIFSSPGTDIAIAGDNNIAITTVNGEIGLVGRDILIKKTLPLIAPLAAAPEMIDLESPFEPFVAFAPLDTFLDIESEDNIKLTSAGVVDLYGTFVNTYCKLNMTDNRITNLGTPSAGTDAATKNYVDTTSARTLAQVLTAGNSAGTNAINMNANAINNAKVIQTQAVAGTGQGLNIKAPYQLGLADPVLRIEAGDNRPDVNNLGVNIVLQKNIRSGTSEENIGQINFYGLTSIPGNQTQMGTINLTSLDSTVGNIETRMSFTVRKDDVNATMLFLNGATNEVLIGGDANTTLNMAAHTLENTKTIQAQPVNGQGVIIETTNQLTPSDPALTITGGANRSDISNSGVNMNLQKTIRSGTNNENLGQLNFFGLDSAGVNNQFAYINGMSLDSTAGLIDGRITLAARKDNVLSDYLVVDGVLDAVNVVNHKIVNLATPTNPSDAANKSYVDSAIGAAPTLATVLLAGNSAGATSINMNGNDITSVNDITNTAGEINITANDLNLAATGLTSVLNINSVLGTVVASAGAIDITAGGTTIINSTGNVSIGSLGTTSIENLNLNNSVLSKVPATADLQLQDIASITNTANIDITAANVKIEEFNFNTATMSRTATTDLILNNIGQVNNALADITIGSVGNVNVEQFRFNEAVLNRTGTTDLTLNNIAQVNNTADIAINATNVKVEQFNFNTATMSRTGTTDLILNNIAKLNETTPGSAIESYATIVSLGAALNTAVGFQTLLNADTGPAKGFFSDTTTASDTGEPSYGFHSFQTSAADGDAVGVRVDGVAGGTFDNATGVEITGTFTGGDKRGVWEHSSGSVVNTFMNPVGIGADPAATYALDVNGNARILTTTAGGHTALQLENTDAGNLAQTIQVYKNSASPAALDNLGTLQFSGNSSTGAKRDYASMVGVIANPANGAHSGEYRWLLAQNGTTQNFMTLNGNTGIANVNPNGVDIDFACEDTSGRNLIYADAGLQNVMLRNYPQRYIYDIAGTYTLTLPNGFNHMRMLAYGAGGGGGSGRLAPNTAFGGGAGGGGNGVELWFDRRELFADSVVSMSFVISVATGGAGGAAQTTPNTNGNNGGAGGQTFVQTSAGGYSMFYQLTGGNGGSGGTNANGFGGGGATFSGSGGLGTSGRGGASCDTINGQPSRNTAAAVVLNTTYIQTGGSGAGGGLNAAGTVAYQGGTYVTPMGQKFFSGANVNTFGGAGNAANTVNATAGSITTTTIAGQTPAVRPLTGGSDLYGGGGGSACTGAFSTGGGDGGGSTAGVAGGRGSGGGGGGASAEVRSGAGGRGSDGFVMLTFW